MYPTTHMVLCRIMHDSIMLVPYSLVVQCRPQLRHNFDAKSAIVHCQHEAITMQAPAHACWHALERCITPGKAERARGREDEGARGRGGGRTAHSPRSIGARISGIARACTSKFIQTRESLNQRQLGRGPVHAEPQAIRARADSL